MDGEALGGSLEEEVSDDVLVGFVRVGDGRDVQREPPPVPLLEVRGERAGGPSHLHLVAPDSHDLQRRRHLDPRHLRAYLRGRAGARMRLNLHDVRVGCREVLGDPPPDAHPPGARVDARAVVHRPPRFARPAIDAQQDLNLVAGAVLPDAALGDEHALDALLQDIAGLVAGDGDRHLRRCTRALGRRRFLRLCQCHPRGGEGVQRCPTQTRSAGPLQVPRARGKFQPPSRSSQRSSRTLFRLFVFLFLGM